MRYPACRSTRGRGRASSFGHVNEYVKDALGRLRMRLVAVSHPAVAELNSPELAELSILVRSNAIKSALLECWIGR